METPTPRFFILYVVRSVRSQRFFVVVLTYFQFKFIWWRINNVRVPVFFMLKNTTLLNKDSDCTCGGKREVTNKKHKKRGDTLSICFVSSTTRTFVAPASFASAHTQHALVMPHLSTEARRTVGFGLSIFNSSWRRLELCKGLSLVPL